MSERTRQQRYRRSVKGLLVTLYGGAVQKATRRGQSLPAYTLADFRDRFSTDANFLALYKIWVNSGYDTMLKPSVDRLDNTQSYTWDNIQMVDWRTNLLNANQKTNPKILHRPVYQLDKTTGEILNEYESITAANAALGVNKSHISSVCRGNSVRKSAGGYKWIYKQESQK